MVSAADFRPSFSFRYQCIHSWQYRNRNTSRGVRNVTPSVSQMNRIVRPGLRLAPYGTTSPNGKNGSGTCSVIERSAKSVHAERCGRSR